MGACEVEHGLEVSEGAVSACFPLSRRENAHEALHEGVGEKAFPGGEDAVEVLGEGPGEFRHGCEQRVSGVGDSEVAHSGTQTAVRLSVVGAGVEVLEGPSHWVGRGRAPVEWAHGFEASALGLLRFSGFCCERERRLSSAPRGDPKDVRS